VIRFLFFFITSALRVFSATNSRLIWNDEFNGDQNAPPDTVKWSYDLGDGGWGNQELEVYTSNRENIFQDGKGHLVIRAVKTSTGTFTSARIHTKGKFAVQYGKIEARIKIPRGQGMWPAFWMLGGDDSEVGWPKCGEIDVMENIGKEPSLVHGTVHGPGYSGKHGIGSEHQLPGAPPLADDFHIYGAEWSPNSIKFLIDGTIYGTVGPASLPKGATWVYDHPFFLILNVAVGGGWPGNPDETTVLPQTMLVDWVRVSKRAD
jgi:beta-glucanase (GH16 family)